MKIIVLFIFLIYSSEAALAEGFKTEKDIRTFSDNLISQIVKEEFQKAYNSAKPYWPLPVVEIDNMVNQIKLKWSVVNQRFGKAVGTEFIKEERIGQSFLRYYYLHKFKNHAIFWRIDFYKPGEEWKINSIIFYDMLDSLYE